MTVSRMIARPMLASIFVVGATTALKSTSGPAAKADPVTSRLVPLARKAGIPLPEDPETLVKLNAGVQIGAGLALATGRLPRLSAAVLAASLVPTTAAGHRFWESDDDATRTQQRLHFFKNVAMAGGLLQVVAWADHRRRRHRGTSGPRMADPPCRQGRPPRGQADQGQGDALTAR